MKMILFSSEVSKMTTIFLFIIIWCSSFRFFSIRSTLILFSVFLFDENCGYNFPLCEKLHFGIKLIYLCIETCLYLRNLYKKTLVFKKLVDFTGTDICAVGWHFSEESLRGPTTLRNTGSKR